MSFGIQTFGPNGELWFDGSKKALRVLYHQTVDPSFVGNISIPGINPWNAAAFCQPRTNTTYDRILLATVGEDHVNLKRLHNGYPPKTPLDLIVVGYA